MNTFNEKTKIQELENDAFYFKLENEGSHIKWAYLHYEDIASNIYLVIFEGEENQDYKLYKWEEEEKGDKFIESRKAICKFYEEAYEHIQNQSIGKIDDQPLWRTNSHTNWAGICHLKEFVREIEKEINNNLTSK